jgi:hydrogenase nickel incorporation protein HypA/HybF
MAFAESILGLVLDVAGDEQVWRVQVRVGELHAVKPESLRYAFQLVAQDTPAANADLDIIPIPVRLFCRSCQVECEPNASEFCCTHCGGFDVELWSGDELLLDAVELDQGWRRRQELRAA